MILKPYQVHRKKQDKNDHFLFILMFHVKYSNFRIDYFHIHQNHAKDFINSKILFFN